MHRSRGASSVHPGADSGSATARRASCAVQSATDAAKDTGSTLRRLRRLLHCWGAPATAIAAHSSALHATTGLQVAATASTVDITHVFKSVFRTFFIIGNIARTRHRHHHAAPRLPQPRPTCTSSRSGCTSAPSRHSTRLLDRTIIRTLKSQHRSTSPTMSKTCGSSAARPRGTRHSFRHFGQRSFFTPLVAGSGRSIRSRQPSQKVCPHPIIRGTVSPYASKQSGQLAACGTSSAAPALKGRTIRGD